MSFGYTGNQLKYVNDAAPNITLSSSADFKNNSNTTNAEYDFNKNGAMTKDLNRGALIVYNSLNLPQQVDIKSPVAEARSTYTYTASGVKLRVSNKWNPGYSTTPIMGTDISPTTLTSSKVTDYVGNKIYEDGILKRILTDNGYIEGNTYYFYIKDHLGNNRIIANSSGSVIQSTEYYPFGMAFAESTNQGAQPYKYNGKELDQDHGLNWYDYSARYLTNDVPRFTTMDPLSEKFYNWSPYVYCKNNPILRIDPDGKQDISALFGSPTQLQSHVIQQKAQKLAIDASTQVPVGISVSLNGNASGGVAGGFSFSAAYLTDGLDKGTLNGYSKGSGGTGVPGGALTFGIDLIYFDGNKSNFTAQSLNGGSTDASIIVGEGVVGGVSHSRGDKSPNGQVTTSGLQLGFGGGPLPVSVGAMVSTTGQFAGSKDSPAKQEKLTQQKQQQEVENRQSTQRDNQGMFSSLWNWLIN